MSRPSAVLDAWALVALLGDEPARPRVQSAIEEGALASWVNLGEVLYVYAARVGIDVARAAVESAAANLVAEAPDVSLVIESAQIKAQHRVSYADAFAVATAERHGLPLLTGDPELVDLHRDGFEVADLREG